MANVTLYLPDDLQEYARQQDLKLSALLQLVIKDHRKACGPAEQRFRAELEKYRTSPERQAEWERSTPGEPFVPCETCGTAVDPVENCMAMFNPYDAEPVALLAHYPEPLRREALLYWERSGFRDVPLGPQ